MSDLMLKFEVTECSSAKLTKAWGASLVDIMKEPLAVVAASINAVNIYISKIGTQSQKLKKNIYNISRTYASRHVPQVNTKYFIIIRRIYNNYENEKLACSLFKT